MISRTVDFRYVVMRGDADFCEIYPIEGSEPVIRMDDSAEIKMSISGSFAPDDRVSWLSDRIRAEMILDGRTYPLGRFLPATVEITETESQRSVNIEAYDQCWLVRDFSTESPVSIGAGVNYITAIQSLLVQAGISIISATPTQSTLAEARAGWDIGTGFLEIVNELLSEINYKPLWFNAQGVAILEPKITPSAENIRHTLDEQNVKSLLLPGIRRETDIYSKPNVFICICSNPDKSGNMLATAENNNVYSPLSIAKRGRRIVKTVKVDNIASQDELQRYADLLVSESMYSGEIIEVTTGIFPEYGVGDIVALNMAGVFSVCIEHSWEMSLRVGGEMRHKLERVVYQYDTD